MPVMDLTLSAVELGHRIARGAADPRALAEMFLNAIDTHPHGASIYARTTRARAAAEAEAAHDRARQGRRRSMLDGVPISWKDLFDTAGIKTVGGSALLRGRVPDHDAQLLKAADAAGLICLGKTQMSELAYSGLGLNPVCGTPPNVNDPELAPGGSSSGAAASVAFGLAAAAIGSDTGGSVRLPAAWNDLVGFKPTHGRLSLEGALPLCRSFDTAGPLVRSVADAAALVAALEDRPMPSMATRLANKRLLVLETVALDDLEPPVATGFERACQMLRDGGAHLETCHSPEVAAAAELSACLYNAEAYAEWRDRIEATPDIMFANVLERFRTGIGFSALDFAKSWTRLRSLRQDFAERIAGHDGVILPTCPIMPPPRDHLLADAAYFAHRNLLALRNTRIGNLMGTPGLTLPTATPSVGMMVLGRTGHDERLLSLGAAIESHLST